MEKESGSVYIINLKVLNWNIALIRVHANIYIYIYISVCVHVGGCLLPSVMTSIHDRYQWKFCLTGTPTAIIYQQEKESDFNKWSTIYAHICIHWKLKNRCLCCFLYCMIIFAIAVFNPFFRDCTIRHSSDETWNVLNMQDITPNSKK